MRLSKGWLFVLTLLSIAFGCRDKGGATSDPQGREDMQIARLHLAAREGDLELVRSLVADGCNINARNEDGCVPLCTAAAYGQTKVAEFLISRGADVNAEDLSGVTALYHAASRADTATVALLIKAGANVNAGKDGWTPLYVASLADQGEVARVLLASGARVFPGDTLQNRTLLCSAVRHWLRDIAEEALAAGANANVMNAQRSSRSLLADATICGDEEMARLLIEYGANVNLKNEWGMRPLCYANRSNANVIRLLLDNNADVNLPGVLHAAVSAGEKEIVELFLAHGADVNVKDHRGSTALDEAVNRGEQEIAGLLRKHMSK